jgi:hypothetical protein
MNLKLSTVLWTFIWCLFMGITVGSIGIGAIFPAANLIARPFVCPGGEMQLVTQDYHPSPVETVTTLTWYCVDGLTGRKTELGIFPMSLYAGTIYGLALFVVVSAGMVIYANRRGQTQDTAISSSQRLQEESEKLLEESERLRERSARQRKLGEELANLQKLLESNQISKEEYRKRAAEIARDL